MARDSVSTVHILRGKLDLRFVAAKSVRGVTGLDRNVKRRIDFGTRN